jgi:hypothetical protein
MEHALPPEARLRRRAATTLLHVLLAALLLRAVLAPALAPRRETRPPPPLAVDLAIDPAWRLRLLPDVGPARARALLEHRRVHGAPRTSSDLLRVPGFGPARVAALVAATEVRAFLAGRPLEALPEGSER